MNIKPKDFLTIIESARIATKRLNLIYGFILDINSYTRGLIESAFIFGSIDISKIQIKKLILNWAKEN